MSWKYRVIAKSDTRFDLPDVDWADVAKVSPELTRPDENLRNVEIAEWDVSLIEIPAFVKHANQNGRYVALCIAERLEDHPRVFEVQIVAKKEEEI